MKIFGYSPTLLIVLSTTLIVLSVAQVSRANEQATPMALRTVMEQLEQNMQSVTSAIAREDWAKVTQLAPQIGSHPQPPLREKMRVLTWLGANAGEFRGFDKQTHEAAEAMGAAAARSDGDAVIAAFAKVQQSCLSCHQSYRTSFKEHFYGQR